MSDKPISACSKGNGKLDTVVLRHTSGATAEIYLLGATLCSYKTPDGKEHIFVSPGAIFDGKKAIRGGVPVVFPQFGQPDKAMAQHGFARSSVWSVKELKDSVVGSTVVLALGDSEKWANPAIREKWPNPFALEFIVTLTPANLTMRLRVTNTGDNPFKFMMLLHTYFNIPDIGQASVRGLKGRNYIDKVAGGVIKSETRDQVLIPSFTDRIYVGTEAAAKCVTVHSDKEGQVAVFELSMEASIEGIVKPCDVVVWNPYEEASPGDLPPPAFKSFVCVEPGLVSDFSELTPKACAELSQRIVPKSGPSKGKGGLDTVALRHVSGASAVIYLLGATLCSYRTRNGEENIFVSPGAIFDGKKAIRGGVPLVFPQFGQPDKSMPQHGFARSSMWSVKEIRDSPAESRAVFTLSDSPETRAKWPHAFALEFVVALTSTFLQMTIRVTNTGNSAFEFMALLHTYFSIPDIGRAAVRGLKGRNYIDKVAGDVRKAETGDQVVLSSFADRIYVGTEAKTKTVSVHSDKESGATTFELTNEARMDGVVSPCDIVTWNPYEAASPGDLPPPAFKNFICVEPGIVSHFEKLAPKKCAEVSQKIEFLGTRAVI